MIGLTLAIGDFMALLVSSALWIAAGVLGKLLAGAGVLGGAGLIGRRMWRRRG